MKLLNSVLFFLFYNYSFSQGFAAYYNEVILNKESLNYFSIVEEKENSIYYVKKAEENFAYGFVRSRYGDGGSEEYFILGPIDSFWFVIQGFDWDEKIKMELDSLGKLVHLYCYNNTFEPLYLIKSIYGYPEELSYIRLTKNNYFGSNSTLITELPRNIIDLSFTHLIKLGEYDEMDWGENYTRNIKNIREKLDANAKNIEIFSRLVENIR